MDYSQYERLYIATNLKIRSLLEMTKKSRDSKLLLIRKGSLRKAGVSKDCKKSFPTLKSTQLPLAPRTHCAFKDEPLLSRETDFP